MRDHRLDDFGGEFFAKYPRCFPTGRPICGAHCGRGWWPLLHELFGKLEQLELPEGFRIEQLKEKFGLLDIHVNAYSDAVYQLIREAMAKARTTCEYCGAPGALGGRYWVKTLCENCEKERDR
jgi:hypothetical protein